ncbi:MAG: efflux RND transporter periplasmic adaptor subunit [Pseudomonadales bacterium]
MKKILLILLTLTVVCVFAGTAIFLYQKSQEKPIIYQTDGAFRIDIVKKTVATGSIKPRKEVEIKPHVSGVVEKLFVQAGDLVKKGDLLARIELIPDMEHLSNAESRLESARINLKTAKIEFERQGQLFQRKLIGELEFNKYELNYALQMEAVQSAENTVSLIKEGTSKNSAKIANLVTSTIDGMVLAVPVREGTFVTETNNFNQGTTIASIANMKDLIFEGLLDESEIGKVKVGMELLLNIGALSDQQFSANLEYISPKGTNDQGTIKFEIKAAMIVQEDFFLRAGYSANADIVLDSRIDALAVNEGNLIIEDGTSFLEIETGPQEFKKTAIMTGLSDGINIEILEGISEATKFKKLVL